MSIDLVIKYRDAAREDGYFPFAFQHYARDYWWPIAQQLRLEHLQQLELLEIRERDDAEKLVDEILAVRQYVAAASPDQIPSKDAAYLLERIDRVVPFLQEAISEWESVDHLYM